MNQLPKQNGALGYLLGGVGLLAMSFFVVPGLAVVDNLTARLGLLAMLALGAGALYWAVRRFTSVGELVASVLGIVVGWYILIGLINAVLTFTAF